MSQNKETYKGIYAMHKYWGKKPFNEISKFIEKYSVKGDSVMDSFCGSGVTLVEALKLGRKCVGIDLNPIAIKLTEVSLTRVKPDRITDEYKIIENNLKKQINSLYEMDYKGEKTTITHIIWKNDDPIEVWYSTNNKRKLIRDGLPVDIEMSNKPLLQPKWYPKTLMFENSRINVSANQTVADLFTPRAIVALSLIAEEINKIKDNDLRNVFQLTLSGTLSQASKLVFVIRRRSQNVDNNISKAEVGSWVIGYWIPEEHFEINVWNCFENRFKRILKGENEIYSIFSNFPKNYFKDFVTLINGSATNIPLENASIDYVFIDPPHSNRIPYMEQSLMWNAWLSLDNNIDWDNEIIVSEAKERKNKNDANYNNLLSLSFSEISRVLKKDKYISMAFNCLNDNTWINTLNAFIVNGFELDDIVPLEYSATSVVQDNRKNALKTDFVLTFKNSKNTNLSKIKINNNSNILHNKIKSIIEYNPKIQVYSVINILFQETIPKGYIFKISEIIHICNLYMS